MCLLITQKWKWVVKFTLTRVCENGNVFNFRGSYSENFFAFSYVKSERSDKGCIKSLKKVQLSFNFQYSAQEFENVSAYFIWIPNMRLIWENAYVYCTLYGTLLCEVYSSTIYIVHALRSKVFLDLAYYSNGLRNSTRLSFSHTAKILRLLYKELISQTKKSLHETKNSS